MINPTNLRVDDHPEPMGVDHPDPVFAWVPVSAERAQTQSAYQVLVASSAQGLAADRGDLWDSRWVESAVTTGVQYAGAPRPTGGG